MKDVFEVWNTVSDDISLTIENFDKNFHVVNSLLNSQMIKIDYFINLWSKYIEKTTGYNLSKRYWKL